MNSGWYALEDGSRKYWSGAEWLDAEPLSGAPDAVQAPLEVDAPPPPVRGVESVAAARPQRTRMFALLAIGLVVGNAFFPPGLLERPAWIWERLSYLAPVEMITPWYGGVHIRYLELALWWIGIVVATVFVALRKRPGALVGIIAVAVPTSISLVTFVARMGEYQIWNWGLASAAWFVVDILVTAALMAVAIVMVARLDARAPVAPARAPGSGTPEKTNSLAIAALLASVLTFWIVGIVLGHVALSQIKRSGDAGRGLALAGVIIGYVGWAIGLVVLIAFQQWWYSY